MTAEVSTSRERRDGSANVCRHPASSAFYVDCTMPLIRRGILKARDGDRKKTKRPSRSDPSDHLSCARLHRDSKITTGGYGEYTILHKEISRRRRWWLKGVVRASWDSTAAEVVQEGAMLFHWAPGHGLGSQARADDRGDVMEGIGAAGPADGAERQHFVGPRRDRTQRRRGHGGVGVLRGSTAAGRTIAASACYNFN
jgi:hypothetical protein